LACERESEPSWVAGGAPLYLGTQISGGALSDPAPEEMQRMWSGQLASEVQLSQHSGLLAARPMS